MEHASPATVMYLIWSLEVGGAEQVVLQLARSLDRSRFRPVICCLNGPGSLAGHAHADGIEVIPLHKRGPVDLRVVPRLVRAMRTRDVRVLHAHLWGANLWGRIAGRIARVPVLITEHSTDTWKPRWYFLIDRVLAPWTAALTAVSAPVAGFYEDRGVGRGRWTVVRNGVDVDRWLPHKHAVATHEAHARMTAAYAGLGIDPGSQVIGCVGRLIPDKAPDLFLEACALALAGRKDATALVVGDGPLRHALAQRAAAPDLRGRVVCAGTRVDLPELYAGMDLLVIPSRREGLPMALLEAMAAGVPVAATSVGGIPTVLQDGVQGRLVAPGDPRVLADAMREQLDNPDKARARACAARDLVRARYSRACMAAAYQDLYARVVKGEEAGIRSRM